MLNLLNLGKLLTEKKSSVIIGVSKVSKTGRRLLLSAINFWDSTFLSKAKIYLTINI